MEHVVLGFIRHIAESRKVNGAKSDSYRGLAYHTSSTSTGTECGAFYCGCVE